MKALLMHRAKAFELQNEDPCTARALTQDLELGTLLGAMAGDDEFLLDVSRRAVLSGLENDVDTILYRQGILRDCLRQPTFVKELYNLTVAMIERSKRNWWGMNSHYTSSMLYSAIDLLEASLSILRKLRSTSEEFAGQFESDGFITFFAMLRRELSEDYLASIEDHLEELKFRKGAYLSVGLGENGEGTNYVLLQNPGKGRNWFTRILGKGPPGYTFYLADRDEAGARILSEMRHLGISRVAIAIAQSANHVFAFFKMLRTELAFYVACLNLHSRLTAKNEPICLPTPALRGTRKHCFSGLYDVCLSLHMGGRVVGNTMDADGKNLTIITGANQGGKSSFLRAIGLAQLMMQCGMFVGAEKFEAEVCSGLFTHYKRGEDPKMNSGKFDEELARMSEIVEHITPNSMALFNESFAATNEREGSEIARQIVLALIDKDVKVFYVTHLYEFARCFVEQQEAVLFLRAERTANGTRTFRLNEAAPLATAYGQDLYRQIFQQDESSQNPGETSQYHVAVDTK